MEAITTSLTGVFSTVQTDALAILGVVVAAGAVIFGVKWVTIQAFGWFKAISRK